MLNDERKEGYMSSNARQAVSIIYLKNSLVRTISIFSYIWDNSDSYFIETIKRIK